MNIHDIGKAGNVDRGGDRTKQPGVRHDVLMPFVGRDEARISASSRETAAAVESLTERARRDGSDRADVVAKALQRLMNGDLDDPQVHAATAQRLLDAKFLSG